MNSFNDDIIPGGHWSPLQTVTVDHWRDNLTTTITQIGQRTVSESHTLSLGRREHHTSLGYTVLATRHRVAEGMCGLQVL